MRRLPRVRSPGGSPLRSSGTCCLRRSWIWLESMVSCQGTTWHEPIPIRDANSANRDNLNRGNGGWMFVRMAQCARLNCRWQMEQGCRHLASTCPARQPPGCKPEGERSPVLKGDLTTTPIDIALAALADEAATGCLHVVDDEGSEALIYLKSGLIYAVSVPGQRPQLGARLISSNVLVPENLAEALEAQRTELQGWRLGELLVHLGFVEQDVVEAFVQEQVRDGLTDLLAWTSGRWRFRKAEKTREDVAPPTALNRLLEDVRTRQSTWEDIVDAVHGPNAVPMLAPHGGEAHITLDPDTWSLLCKIDGERSIADLARECGFTMFEAGTVVRVLVEAGLVDVEEDVGPDGAPVDDEDEPAEAASAPARKADSQTGG